MEKTKIHNLALFLYSWRSGKRIHALNIPLEVNLEVTNLCNFRCSFCMHSKEDHFNIIEKSSLTTEMAGDILKKIREFGYLSPTIHWSMGGEPFMNPSFHEISKIAVAYGFYNQYFATNGSLLTMQKIMLLPKEAKFTFVIDYSADEAYFEKYRGWGGSWKEIYNNIIALVENENVSNMSVVLKDMSSFTVNNKNELNKNYLQLQGMFPKSEKIRYMTKRYHNAGGFLWAAEKEKKYHICPNPWSLLAISANGDVVACDRDIEHRTILGNIHYSESIDDIWNGEKAKQLRKSLIERNLYGVCEGCDMPYDGDKFSYRYMIRTIFNRLQIQKQ